MDVSTLLVIVGGGVGGFLTGLAGFGTGLAAMPIWLFAVSPVVAAQLAASCGVVGQSLNMPAVWPHVRLKRIWHFIAAGLLGVPLGTYVLPLIPDRQFKLGVGVFLLLFCAYALATRNRVRWTGTYRFGDIAVGFVGGFLAGVAGLSGPVPTAWATLHDWSRDEKRALFQCFNLTTLFAMLISGAIAGQMSWAFGFAFIAAIPGTLVGAFIGYKVYQRLTGRNFDTLILAMLALSGSALLIANT
ncbi:MAG: sulfite exporter TauE/SafE family protein [Pseudomonadota bacterium]